MCLKCNKSVSKILLDVENQSGIIALVNEVSKAAATLGRLGGLAKSAKKTDAVRQNGKRGGRPRKTTRVKVEVSQ